MELCLRGNDYFVADRNVAHALAVFHVADANGVTVLLDRRIRFEFVNVLFDVAAEVPAGSANLAVDFDSTRSARFHRDFTGAGLDVHVHRAGDAESAVEMALLISEGAEGADGGENSYSQKNRENTQADAHHSISFFSWAAASYRDFALGDRVTTGFYTHPRQT